MWEREGNNTLLAALITVIKVTLRKALNLQLFQ